MPRKKSQRFHCCEKCQNYWTCEKKWYRGENGQENLCCSLCHDYQLCAGSDPSNIAKRQTKSSR